MSHTTLTYTRTHRVVTGASGLLVGVLSMIMIGLYFGYSGPPPLTNVLARNLITVVVLTALLIFAVGLHRLLTAAHDGDAGLSGSVSVAALLAYVAVVLVSASLETGTSLWHPDGSMDPTVDGPLSAAAVLLHGPISRVLLATYLIASTIASRGQVLPAWLRTGNVVLAVVNLALVPSLFFGMDAAFVYASNGWGSVAAIGAVNTIWFAVTGASVLRGHDVRTTEASLSPANA